VNEGTVVDRPNVSAAQAVGGVRATATAASHALRVIQPPANALDAHLREPLVLLGHPKPAGEEATIGCFDDFTRTRWTRRAEANDLRRIAY
jgi:hypothetical protein